MIKSVMIMCFTGLPHIGVIITDRKRFITAGQKILNILPGLRYSIGKKIPE